MTVLGIPPNAAGLGAELAIGLLIGLERGWHEREPLWLPAQATLLRDEILEDADSAEIVDKLDAALRSAD